MTNEIHTPSSTNERRPPMLGYEPAEMEKRKKVQRDLLAYLIRTGYFNEQDLDRNPALLFPIYAKYRELDRKDSNFKEALATYVEQPDDENIRHIWEMILASPDVEDIAA